MWNDDKIGDASDRAFARAMYAHTAFSSDQAERDAWVHDRIAQIMADRDYHDDLILTLMENGHGGDILWAIRHATVGSCASSIAALNMALTDIARKIAEGEAERRFA